jgi:hypothetical protein
MAKDKNEQKPLPKERKFRQIEAPDFFKFESIGDKIEGRLQEKAVSDNYGIGLFTLKQDDGGTKRIHGSANLDSLMTGVDIGDYVRIEWVDTKAMEKGKTPMKIFNVEVEETEKGL